MMYNIINRDDVIETLRTTPIHVTGVRLGKLILPQYENKCREIFIEAVQHVSPLDDVEPVRHGYWVERGKTEKGSTIIQCSYCGKERAGIAKSKYCRDCGAKMDAMERDFLI